MNHGSVPGGGNVRDGGSRHLKLHASHGCNVPITLTTMPGPAGVQCAAPIAFELEPARMPIGGIIDSINGGVNQIFFDGYIQKVSGGEDNSPLVIPACF